MKRLITTQKVKAVEIEINLPYFYMGDFGESLVEFGMITENKHIQITRTTPDEFIDEFFDIDNGKPDLINDSYSIKVLEFTSLENSGTGNFFIQKYEQISEEHFNQIVDKMYEFLNNKVKEICHEN